METSSFFKAKRSSTPRSKDDSPKKSTLNTSSRMRPSLKEPMDPTEIIKMILKKPADERNDLDLKRVVPFLKQIKFFKDRNLKDQDLIEIASALWLESYYAEETVFEYGERGHKFYIVIEGKVEVYVPSPSLMLGPRKKPSSKMSVDKDGLDELIQNTHLETNLAPSPISDHRKRSFLESSNISSAPTPMVEEGKENNPRNPEDALKGFLKVGVVAKEKGFGELALIKNQPRAATIKCVRNCQFAVMDRQTYRKVLGKIEQKRLNKAVDFLQSLPFFSSWTRSTISKFQYLFERKDYIRNQIVYREGDHAEYVYLITQGQFELSMKYRSEMKKEVDITTYLGPAKKQSSQALATRRSESSRDVKCSSSHIERLSSNPKPVNETVRRVQNMRLMLLFSGNFFGEDDALARDRNYHAYTAKCLSQEGTVLAIKAADLIKKIKNHDDTFKMIIENVIHKEEYAQIRKKQNHKFQKASMTLYALGNPFQRSEEQDSLPTAAATPIQSKPIAQDLENYQQLQVYRDNSEIGTTIGKATFYSRKNSSMIQSPPVNGSPRSAVGHSRKWNSNAISLQNFQPSQSPPKPRPMYSSTTLLRQKKQAVPMEFPRDGSNFSFPNTGSVANIKPQGQSRNQPTQHIMSGSSILSKQAPYTANSYRQIAKHSRIKSRDYLDMTSKNVYLPQAYTFNVQTGGKRLIPRMKPIRSLKTNNLQQKIQMRRTAAGNLSADYSRGLNLATK